MSIRVLAAGMLTTVQDGGRRHCAALGVGCAGAMDDVALRLANILVGNVDNAAALEMTLRGPRLRFEVDATIAITGADIAAHCDGESLPTWRPVLVHSGSELAFGGMASGMRSYLAIAGGIDVAPVLHSRSTDVNSAIGGRALAAGDVLAVAPATMMRHGKRHATEVPATEAPITEANWSLDPRPWFAADAQQPIRVIAGTHFSQLASASQRVLFAGEFRIDADSNRVGYRLHGAALNLREPLELVSTGVVPGTVQLPPGGDPIVLMAEAPTCGGYARIAQVIAVDLARLAQRRPGSAVRFAETSLEEAQQRYLERERVLARIAQNVAERTHDQH